jgi:hypothetical protein
MKKSASPTNHDTKNFRALKPVTASGVPKGLQILKIPSAQAASYA